MTVRKDVEIDYCPQCRRRRMADRGELDKIIERSNARAGTTTGGRASRNRMILAMASNTSVALIRMISIIRKNPRSDLLERQQSSQHPKSANRFSAIC